MSASRLPQTTAPARPNRPRATAFDAARSGSWHYYRPVAHRSNSSSSSQLQSELNGNDSEIAVPIDTAGDTTRRERPIFDAANPATWPNRSAIRYQAAHRSETTASAASNPSVRGRIGNGGSQARLLEQWSTYLASSELPMAERTEVLRDVFLALHVDSAAVNQHELSNVSRSSRLRHPRISVMQDAPRRTTDPFYSALDDPDFGDTSQYWNSLQAGQSGRLRTTLLSPGRRSLHMVQSRPISNMVSTPRPVLPRQPTHLNHPGLQAELVTMRRRASSTSLLSHASDGTLPEYTASVASNHLALPDYRARASFEIGV